MGAPVGGSAGAESSIWCAAGNGGASAELAAAAGAATGGAGAVSAADGSLPEGTSGACMAADAATDGEVPDDEIPGDAAEFACIAAADFLSAAAVCDPAAETGWAAALCFESPLAVKLAAPFAPKDAGAFAAALGFGAVFDATKFEETKSDARDETTSKVSRFASRFTLRFAVMRASLPLS
jgi:hypothetical protein